MRRVEVVVRGRVQGVGYRWSCVMEAERQGVAGWVRNQADGSVELWAEGEDDAVEALLAWCRKGPRWSSVDEVELRPVAVHGHTGFTVR